ncbi:MAG: Holliday junction resolvase RuvX [Bacillota bacterium]|jgi:putative Holliday junction resolvase|nr:Holliday junction resolvase RuvX [Bacillota bacterium]NLL26911.1 Holliday junction resolvase RuvX [Erysipelotrichia bacterium]
MNKIMGLDLGSKTCGVALSDALGMIASAVETIRFEEDDYQTCLNKVCEIIDANKVEKVVLGLPRHMNGDEGIRAEISRNFKTMLKEARNVNVILWDERLSTVSAQKSMISANMKRKKRKKMIDTMAAVVILQSYLDAIY